MTDEMCDGTCSVCGSHRRMMTVHTDALLLLTARELEVGRWVCRGKTNGEIASIIGTSLYTVKNQVAGLFAKLGVPNRVGVCAQLGHLFPTTTNRKAPQ